MKPMDKTAISALQKVKRTLLQADVNLAHKRVLALCSGGIDSVALVALLAMMPKGVSPQTVTVLFLDHAYRDQIELEYEAARQVAKRYSFDFVMRKRDHPETKHNGGGKQAVARAWRYEIACKVAREMGCNTICTGHTASDQLEGVLLGLAGITGSGNPRAMSVIRPLKEDMNLVRPLLGISRAEIVQFVKQHNLCFAEDPTNKDPSAYKRNAIRHRVIPELLEISPHAGVSAIRAAQRYTESLNSTQCLAEKLLELWTKDHPHQLMSKDLLSLPEASRKDIIAVWLSRYFPNSRDVDTKAIKAVSQLIKKGSKGELHFAQGVRVKLEQGKLKITTS